MPLGGVVRRPVPSTRAAMRGRSRRAVSTAASPPAARCSARPRPPAPRPTRATSSASPPSTTLRPRRNGWRVAGSGRAVASTPVVASTSPSRCAPPHARRGCPRRRHRLRRASRAALAQSVAVLVTALPGPRAPRLAIPFPQRTPPTEWLSNAARTQRRSSDRRSAANTRVPKSHVCGRRSCTRPRLTRRAATRYSTGYVGTWLPLSRIGRVARGAPRRGTSPRSPVPLHTSPRSRPVRAPAGRAAPRHVQVRGVLFTETAFRPPPPTAR